MAQSQFKKPTAEDFEFPEDATPEEIASFLKKQKPQRVGAVRAAINTIDAPTIERGVGAARSRGFLAGATQSAADLVEGAKAGLMSTAFHGGDLIRAGWNKVAPTSMQADRILNNPNARGSDGMTAEEAMTPPDSASGKIGYYGEQAGEFVAPQMLVSRGAKAANLGWKGTMAAEAALGGVGAGVQTGGDPVAMTVGTVAGPVLMGGAALAKAVARKVASVAAGAADGGVGGAVASAMRGVLPEHPIRSMVQALKPRSSQTNFEALLEVSLPEVKSTARELGIDINGIDDLVTAATAAKKRVWALREQIAGPKRAMGSMVDGTPVADAMEQSLPSKVRLESPGRAQATMEKAAAYRRQFTLEEAETLLRETNAQLESFYNKYPMAQRKALASDPKAASLIAQATALRKGIYGVLDAPGQPPAARELSRRYGALMELEDTAMRRANVAKRQQPDSLSEQIGGVRAASQFASGAYRAARSAVTGDMAGAIAGTADMVGARAGREAAKYLKDRNTTDSLIKRAFASVGDSVPVEMPVARPIAGHLERGAIPMEPGPDGSYVRGVPAQPAQRDVRGLLGPAPREPIPLGPVPDDSYARGVEPGRSVQRNSKTGRGQRIYDGGAGSTVAGMVGPVASTLVPDDPDSNWDEAARVGLNVAGMAAMAAGAKKSPVLAKAKPLLEKLFPKYDAYAKPRGFIKPEKIIATLRENDAPAEVIELAESWLKGSKPVKPAEVVAVLSGEKFDRGRVLRRVGESEDKKLPGAPLGVTTTRQETALRDKYTRMVEEGVAGREWYRDAGSSVEAHSGGNTDTAHKFGRTLAVTSASNTVPSNTGMAVKGHNQGIAGMEVKTGRFPATQSPDIEAVYAGSMKDIGPKREPFAQQMAIGGGYADADDKARAVHDIWQGEAFGYVNPDGTPLRRGFQKAEHEWMDKQTERVISDLNARKVGGFDDWDTGTTQAAAWTAAKIRAGQLDPKDAAKSYADYMSQHHIQTSRDHIPGATTGHMKGLSTAPLEVRREYAKRVEAILYDSQGRDNAGVAKQLLTGGSIEGPGIRADDAGMHMHPGRQVKTAVGTVDSPQGRDIDAASMANVKHNEAEYGLLTGQDAIAGSKLDYGAKAAQRDSVDFPLPEGTLTHDSPLLRSPEVLRELQAQRIAVIPTDGGVRFLNLGMEPKQFNALAESLAGGAQRSPGRNQGFYVGNDWSAGEGRAGGDYMREINSHPKGREWFDRMAPKHAAQLNALDEEFSKRGFQLDSALMDLRRAIADNGYKGATEFGKRFGLKLSALAVMIKATEAMNRQEAQ